MAEMIRATYGFGTSGTRKRPDPIYSRCRFAEGRTVVFQRLKGLFNKSTETLRETFRL